MTQISILSSSFEAQGNMDLELSLDKENVRPSVVHLVIKGVLANRRQSNAMTKNKAMVSGGGAKPFKQKGTGRARQGSNRSPSMVGGGVVFGPVNTKTYEQKINKKVFLKALHSLLADKFQNGKLLLFGFYKGLG